jgi:adenylosuccinate lyase
MINNMIRVIEGLTVSSQRISDNINKTKGRIFAEFILEALVKKGIPRMKAYDSIQRVAFETLVDDRNFKDAIMKDPSIGEYLNKNELRTIFDANSHLAASTRIIKNVIKRTEQISKKYKSR